ncbi:hypothetical protein WOLCODRAFT_112196 [Wolfiporia cocos MD-104 SS10]|uniref:Uncharacterized protein n=1 Tax=Wolfiporia cocos (strain MD-104) TaxID=742152 RepID=A0A2H3IUG4_WOLCO|nr:hypothetical protein WOLCODRAFT_112196 [Wolfiporia cocos MD-104 SS10]
MGAICSKRDTHSGGHTVLGSANSGEQEQGLPSNPRAAAAEAAERRRLAEQTRGTHSSNPSRGKLAAQLEASKTAPRVPEPRQEERLVWD